MVPSMYATFNVSVKVTYLLSCIPVVSEIGQIIGPIFPVDRGPLFNTLVHGVSLIQMCKIWPQEARYIVLWCGANHISSTVQPSTDHKWMVGWTDILTANAMLHYTAWPKSMR